MVKSGKSQDKKTLTKHAKTSQDSQSKFSKCRPLAFTQVPLVNGLVDDWLLYTRPRCNQASLQIIRITYQCLIHSILHNTPNLAIHWKIHWQHICQKLSKSAQDQQSYCKNNLGFSFFLKHSVVYQLVESSCTGLGEHFTCNLMYESSCITAPSGSSNNCQQCVLCGAILRWNDLRVFVCRTDVMFHLKKRVNEGRTYHGKRSLQRVSNTEHIAATIRLSEHYNTASLEHFTQVWCKVLYMMCFQ